MKKWKYVGAGLTCTLSFYLIIKGQRIPDKWGLTMMLAGLGGLLLNLYLYNLRHT
jgi:hypothetical protein